MSPPSSDVFKVVALYAIKKYLASEMILNEADISNNILIGSNGGKVSDGIFFASNYLSDVMKVISVENFSTFHPEIFINNNNNSIIKAIDFFNFRKRIVSSFIELEQREWPIELVNNKGAFCHIVVYIINQPTNELFIGKYRLMKETIIKIAKMKDGDGDGDDEKDWNDWNKQ